MSLIESAKENNVIELKRLIQNGVDVNSVDEYGHTALMWMAENGCVECATALLDAKADIHKDDAYGCTPLHLASLGGHAGFVRVLCLYIPRGGGECLNTTDVMPLCALQLLIQYKANVNALSNYGSLPLHFASANGHMACVQILVAAGALREMDRPNATGNTPLVYAIVNNYSNIAEYLLHLGAKMSNVKSSVTIPDWMKQIVSKRKNTTLSTFTLKALLRKRFKVPGPEAAFLNGRIPKDMIDLIGLHVWSTRLDPKWSEASKDGLKRMKK